MRHTLILLLIVSLSLFGLSVSAMSAFAQDHGGHEAGDEGGDHGPSIGSHEGHEDGHAHDGDEHGADGHASGGHHGPTGIPLWAVIPFAALLLCIAVLPLTAEHWWEHNTNRAKVAIPLGLLVAGWLMITYGHDGLVSIEHSMVEYLQFIILLGSLYIISGGIVLRGDLRATPMMNSIFLLIGASIASFVGTTGASMLLIRPVLKTNSERKHVVHTVVFFIFMVSNIGGCLTPLGDPPLFLGYLRGVPFSWTFHLWKEWLVLNAILLTVYFIWDTIAFKKEEAKDVSFDKTHIEPVRFAGMINFLFLGGVIAAVAFSASMNSWFHSSSWGEKVGDSVWFANGSPFREIIMIVMVALSLGVTPKALKEENKFSYAPIAEVAILFVGIFLTMIPALLILNEKGGSLGVDNPMKFFWVTGLLSSFLDNAPTYLVFFSTAAGMHAGGGLETFGLPVAGVPQEILIGISLGAVFMGANSYIGNGPNFMVKAVAEESGVKMPSFFGYMKYSFGILIPLFILMSFLFLRH